MSEDIANYLRIYFFAGSITNKLLSLPKWPISAVKQEPLSHCQVFRQRWLMVNCRSNSKIDRCAWEYIFHHLHQHQSPFSILMNYFHTTPAYPLLTANFVTEIDWYIFLYRQIHLNRIYMFMIGAHANFMLYKNGHLTPITSWYFKLDKSLWATRLHIRRTMPGGLAHSMQQLLRNLQWAEDEAPSYTAEWL